MATFFNTNNRKGVFMIPAGATKSPSGNGFSNTKSLAFDGVDEYVSIGTTSLGITSAITVSAWVKIPTTNTGGPAPYVQEFICEDATGGANRNWALNWRHQSVSNKYFGFAVFHTDGSATSIQSTGIVPNDGNWHHVMGTFDGTTNANGLKLYVDGTLFQTTAVSTGIRSTSGVAPSIGAIENGSAYRFEGNIDEVSVFDAVKVEADVSDGTEPIDLKGKANLVSWWRMGDKVTSFPTIPDQEGSNDGTANNMEAGDIVNDVP